LLLLEISHLAKNSAFASLVPKDPSQRKLRRGLERHNNVSISGNAVQYAPIRLQSSVCHINQVISEMVFIVASVEKALDVAGGRLGA